jgi:hypothetical protein
LLQNGSQPVVFAAFDCLFVDGKDLREQPLTARRAALEEAIEGAERIFAARRLSSVGLDAHSEAQHPEGDRACRVDQGAGAGAGTPIAALKSSQRPWIGADNQLVPHPPSPDRCEACPFAPGRLSAVAPPATE